MVRWSWSSPSCARQRSCSCASASMTSGSVATAAGDSSRVPAEFRTMLANRPDPAALLASRGALPGLGAISRLAGHGAERPARDRRRRSPTSGQPRRGARRSAPTSAATSRALNRLSDEGRRDDARRAHAVELYSAPMLARSAPAAGARSRRASPAGRRPPQRIKVLDFRRRLRLRAPALAQVVYRLSIAGAVRALHRSLAADLDRHAGARGRPLAVRPRIEEHRIGKGGCIGDFDGARVRRSAPN